MTFNSLHITHYYARLCNALYVDIQFMSLTPCVSFMFTLRLYLLGV
jgi:hypothetical protein